MESEDIVTREEIKDFLIETGLRREAFGARLGVTLVTVNGWMSIRDIPKKKQLLIREMIDAHRRKLSAPPSFRMRCSASEAEQLQKAADLVGEPVDEFILRACRLRVQAVFGGRDTTGGVSR